MRPAANPARVGRGWLRLGGAAALLVWFGALPLRGLFAPDEGRYGLIPAEMLRSGDWVSPHLDGLLYFEKPPLQYWATALVYAVAGLQEWAVRLWPALCGLATVLALAAYVRRTPGLSTEAARRQALLAAGVLASSLLFFLFSQVATLDMGLSFFLTLALLLYLDVLRRPGLPGAGRWRIGAAWVAIALAMLSKGLVALVLPALAVFAHAALTRSVQPIRAARPVLGIGLVALVAGPWFALVQSRHPSFFDFFVIHEHFARYTSEVHHRGGSRWYFIAVLVAGSLPWTGYAISALADAARALARGARSPAPEDQRFLGLWVAVVVVFFSLSDSKLPPYILPAFPALALLTARRLEASGLRGAQLGTLPALCTGLALSVAAVFLVHQRIDDVEPGMADGYLPWAELAAMMIVAGALGAVALFARARRLAGALALAAGCLAGWQLLLSGAQTFEAAYSARGFVQQVMGRLGPQALAAPWYSVGTFDHSFAFYLQRPLTLVAYQDELAFGLSQDPQAGVPTLEAFLARWQGEAQAYAFMQPQTYEQLRARQLPMVLVGRDARRVLVARRASLAGPPPGPGSDKAPVAAPFP